MARAMVAVVVAALMMAACGSSPVAVSVGPAIIPTVNGDLGATIAQFKLAHVADSGPGVLCTAANACFGPKLRNDESGTIYEFSNVSVDAGIVDAYTANFAYGTTIDEAMAEVLRWLPRDATTTYYAIDRMDGSCVMWNVTSPTLARELGTAKIGDPRGELGITLGYIDANLNNVNESNNVERADISDLPNNPPDTC